MWFVVRAEEAASDGNRMLRALLSLEANGNWEYCVGMGT